eukprot:CAMPEP_0182847978 /NCGR_PEP_ID=MMETSP0006_2-20121128/28750_1 /TAXON_ID=97485 /ORGANISM="Prymnesium parvum, Strain Texoma1" /LENGTH=72 /DNA_ID=CAMNT_0024978355 /DNA_START=515 /DNA_END=729 /DNA_ORIENTATION=+
MAHDTQPRLSRATAAACGRRQAAALHRPAAHAVHLSGAIAKACVAPRTAGEATSSRLRRATASSAERLNAAR